MCDSQLGAHAQDFVELIRLWECLSQSHHSGRLRLQPLHIFGNRRPTVQNAAHDSAIVGKNRNLGSRAKSQNVVEFLKLFSGNLLGTLFRIKSGPEESRQSP